MKLFDIFKRTMLRPDEIVELALQEVTPKEITGSFIRKNFSEIVEKLHMKAYSEYLKVQKLEGENAIQQFLKERIAPKDKPEKIIKIVASCFDEFDRFYLSLAQSRKQRAGSAFEDMIRTLFKRLYYPFEEQIVINGKPDFLMPGEKHYKENAMDCIIFTAKRTLRERWRQIVTEGTRGLGFFLATLDENVSSEQLKEMKNSRIYLVLPKSMKKKIAHYKKAQNVISFEEFFISHLDPAVARWKRAGIIK